jgi:Tetratricopeptide repeat
MKYLLTLSLIIASIFNGHSCINEYRTLLDGEVVLTDRDYAAPEARFNIANKTLLLEKLNQAYNIYKSSHSFKDYSDYAVMLTYNGRYEEAKAIFLRIEEKTPNLYETAANLGTTYELLGQIDSAIYWLTKSLKINPNSHGGSEWIHLKILEAKKLANGDEQKLWNTDILSLGLGENLLPENIRNINLMKIRQEIYSQLTERMSFIQPKDPIIGRLLFDFGNVTALVENVEGALQVYEKARTYGYNSDLFIKREKHFKSIQFKANFMNNTYLWAKRNLDLAFLLLMTIVGVFAFLVFKIKQKNRKTTN